MRAQLAKYWYLIRYSYWFLPSLMALAAIALSAVTFAADVAIGDSWPRGLRQLGLNTPAGARALLSTIAGSMITVAGVSFSITIAAVVFATGQLGPRLLASFMGDRSNQITLGTFIATFVYGLLVLRTVHGADEGEGPAFVPHLGILVAMLLALASLGVLIFFIHHVPRSISATEVVARLGTDLSRRAARLFPRRLGDASPGGLGDVVASLPTDDGVAIRAKANGYVTQIDIDGLLHEAAANAVVVRLHCRPGDFVSAGDTLATIHGGGQDLRQAVHTAIAMARERTNQQDFLFVVQQLVEIAIRALSPGVNDPYTAVSVLDWLGSGAIDLGQREMPSRFRLDADGTPRVVVPAPTYNDLVAAMFDRLRPYAAADPIAAAHMMATLGRVAGVVAHPPYRAALLEQVAALNDAAQQLLPLERDRIALLAIHARLFDDIAAA